MAGCLAVRKAELWMEVAGRVHRRFQFFLSPPSAGEDRAAAIFELRLQVVISTLWYQRVITLRSVL